MSEGKTESDKVTKKESIKIQTWIGAFITILIVGTIAAYIYYDWQSFKKLNPNEWGDFLAGSIGVLALVWLIVGYFLQSKELSQNTKALIEQKAEQVKQTKEIKVQAKATCDMFEFHEKRYQEEKEEKLERAKGVFVYEKHQELDNSTMKYVIRNEGGEIRNIYISSDNKEIKVYGASTFLGKTNVLEASLQIKDPSQTINSALDSKKYKLPILIDINYKDCFNNYHKEKYEITIAWTLLTKHSN
jgi:hypothetical protein